jgi:predicted alpha-1,2-mannosidase
MSKRTIWRLGVGPRAAAIMLLLLALAVAGCAAAVRDGRPTGWNFNPDDYHRLAAAGNEGEASPAELVNTLMGTDSAFAYSHGNTYPAVARPWGMNFWTPQTGANRSGWQYTYRARTIRGFKQTHQPSPWANDYGCFSLMPTVGRAGNSEMSRASRFRHATEIAKPYYYKVHLDRYGVDVEITPTARAAVMRFTYPSTASANLVIDTFSPGGRLEISPGERKITGFTTYRTGDTPDNFKNWFVMVFDADFTAQGERAVRLDTRERQVVSVKIASSFISLEQAERNLAREVGGRDFDTVRDEARAEWDAELARIKVSGGTLEQRVTFYSALYRMLLFPRRFYELDASGKTVHYSPYDGEVHDGYMFTDTGFWDTFRALFPFFTLMYPEFDAQVMQGLLNAYQEGGRLPQWSSPGYYNSMIGSHTASVLADAYVKGIRDFDAELAWQAMVKDAEVPESRARSMGRYGLDYYNRLGYIPSDVGIDQSVSRSLEYAYDDFCMSQFARAAGRPEADVEKYRARALNYKNLFDPSTGFMRPRKQDGSWRAPFKPIAWGGDFTEGSAWHYTWSVFQDPQGLIDLMGGPEAFVAKLDSVFTEPAKADWSAYGYKIHEAREMQFGGMGQYAHGNEPMHHVIYLYDYAGEPWKAQARAREVMDKLYNPYPNGFCGDEDNGQMSAWYVFSALGFYPVCPAVPQYALGSPLFDRAELIVCTGSRFVIEARRNGPGRVYIRRASLNGRELTRNYLTHAEITAGGALVLEMDEKPNQSRGIMPEDSPYSLSKELSEGR